MINFGVTQRGGMTVDGQRERLHRMSQKLKVSEINNIWKSISEEIINIIKTFFYEKEYERIGFGSYKPLSDDWMKKKNQNFITHLFIDTENMMRSITSKVSGGKITVETQGEYKERFNHLHKLRPVIEDNKEYIAEKAHNKFLEILKRELGL